MVVYVVKACVSLSEPVDQAAHDARAQRVSMATHEVEGVSGSTNGFGNHFIPCAAHLPLLIQYC